MEIEVKGKKNKRGILISILVILGAVLIILGYEAIYPRVYFFLEGVTVQKKGSELNITDSHYAALNEIEQELENYELYLTGESHGTQGNYLLWEYFTRFFVEKADVKYILLESGYAVGELLNNYLETGDEDYLYNIMKAFKGSPSYNRELQRYYKNIYEYNESLAEAQKIQFIGIDVEHQYSLAIQYLQELVGMDVVPGELQDVINEIKHWPWYARPGKDTLQEWSASCKTYERLYKDLLGDDYFGFEFVINNLMASTDNQPEREAAIISNFKKVYEHLPKGKYFGQWGSYHTSLEQHRKDMSEPFAAVINKNYEPIKDKVLTIWYRYENCRIMESNGRAAALDTVYFKKQNEHQDSPLIVNTDKSFLLKKMPGNGRTYARSINDLYHYMIVIQNSPATTWLE